MRGHNEGSIRKRTVRDKKTGEVLDERWEARVSLPDGQRKSLYGRSRAEVVTRLRSIQEGMTKGILPSNDGLLVRDYLTNWIEQITLSLEYNTVQRYTQHIGHVIEHIGSRRLTKLSVEDIQAMHVHLLRKGYAASTVQVLHTILHHALKDAIARGLLGRNVCELIRAPKTHAREMQPLTQHEARTLIEGSIAHRLHALWLVAIATGMRIGEMLALEWSDIDFTRGLILVKRSAYYKAGIGVLTKAPKTKKSRRTIRLDASVVNELKAHRSRQNAERLAAGTMWIDKNLIFCTQVGGYHVRSSIADQLRNLLRVLELPKVRIHDLRHTAATLMLANGVNVKVVSEMLGHSNVSITLAVYAHVTEDMQEQAAKTMGNILFH